MADTTPTSTPHRATPEQWVKVRGVARDRVGWAASLASAVLELAARAEALEAQQAQPAATAEADDLLGNLAAMICNFASGAKPGDDCTPFARAVIRIVARWLRANGISRIAADRLEEEAGR